MAELVKKRTKRDIESERKRKKIYEEGIKLFRTYGYDNTTLEDIRQASGMSRGSIYHFFSKKRDILYYFFAETSKEAMNSLVINEENLMKPARAIQDYTVKVAEANEALGYDLACVMQDAYLDASDDTRFSSKFVHDIAVFIEAAQEKGTWMRRVSCAGQASAAEKSNSHSPLRLSQSFRCQSGRGCSGLGMGFIGKSLLCMRRVQALPL